jgi:hypothetical protein
LARPQQQQQAEPLMQHRDSQTHLQQQALPLLL